MPVDPEPSRAMCGFQDFDIVALTDGFRVSHICGERAVALPLFRTRQEMPKFPQHMVSERGREERI